MAWGWKSQLLAFSSLTLSRVPRTMIKKAAEAGNLRITTDADILWGTRITVNAVQERLRDGDTVDHLVDDYPEIPREAIKAAASLDLLALLPSRTVPTFNSMSSGVSTLVGSLNSCGATDPIPAIRGNLDVSPRSSSTA